MKGNTVSSFQKSLFLTSSVPRGNILSADIHIHQHYAQWGLVVKYDINSTNRIWLLLDKMCILGDTAFSEAPWWIKTQAVVIIPPWRLGRSGLVFKLLLPPRRFKLLVIRGKVKSDLMSPLRNETCTAGTLQGSGNERRGGNQQKYWN